jgi:hypothetical protein
MREHHLVDFELQVLLALAGKREPMRWGAAFGQSLEVLVGFGYAALDADGRYGLTPEGIEIADSVAPAKVASR